MSYNLNFGRGRVALSKFVNTPLTLTVEGHNIASCGAAVAYTQNCNPATTFIKRPPITFS